MYIKKIKIENFKCYKGQFSVDLNKGVNVLVGNNEAGKSTILEAIHLALTGMLSGRYLKNELSQYLFNKEIAKEYIDSLESPQRLPPPLIRIELFLADEADEKSLAFFEGNGNSENSKDCGVVYCVEFDEDQYLSEYEELVKKGGINTIPIEYYKVTWRSFARDQVTAGRIPVKSALIDSASTRVQNGGDVYISRIIRETLEDSERRLRSCFGFGGG